MASKPLRAQPSIQRPTMRASAVRLAAVDVSRRYSSGQSGSTRKPPDALRMQQVRVVAPPPATLARLGLEGVDVTDVVAARRGRVGAVAIDDAHVACRAVRPADLVVEHRAAAGRPMHGRGTRARRAAPEQEQQRRRDERPHQPHVPRAALERADDVGGDPAAVEAALLRTHRLTVDRAGEPRRVEGQVAGDRLEAARRCLVGPRDRGEPEHVPVRRRALPLAPRRRRGRALEHARRRSSRGGRYQVGGWLVSSTRYASRVSATTVSPSRTTTWRSDDTQAGGRG